MILLLFIAVGLIIGMLRGGGLSGLVGMKTRWFWLIILSFLAERSFIFIPISMFQSNPILTPALQVLRFLPLILFVSLNVKDWRICVAGLGIALNFAVIAANGWRMPISWLAATIPELSDGVRQLQSGSVPEYFLMAGYAGGNLWFFGDIIPFKFLNFIKLNYVSPGDMFLGLGVLLTVQHGMAKYSFGRHVRGSLADPQKDTAAANEAPHDRAAEQVPAVRRQRQPAPPAPPEQPVTKGPSAPAAPPAPKQAAQAPAAPIQAPKVPAVPESTVASPATAERHTAVRMEEKSKNAVTGKAAGADLQFLQHVSSEEFTPESASSAAGGIPPATVKLTPRLETVARMAESGAIVADIGCDHGKLDAWLALNGTPRVIAIDISSKSLAKTKQLVKEFGLQHTVQTRVGDGLKKLRPGEADIIVMAGIGGPTMCGILESGYAVACSAAKLVLQPMNAVGTVRKWLIDNGFYISDERLAEEDGRIYQILSAMPGTDGCPPMSLFELEIGHILIDHRHPLLPKLLEYKIDAIDKILSEIADNATPKAEARRSELVDLRERCSEALEWLAG